MSKNKIKLGKLEKDFSVKFINAAGNYQQHLASKPGLTNEEKIAAAQGFIHDEDLPGLLTIDVYMQRFATFPHEYKEQVAFLKAIWQEVIDR